MTLSNFVAYVKQLWKNKPDTSTPLSAERLTHLEEGIKGNSDAIQELAAAVVSQIVNDPNKIASMAALYAVNQKIGDTSKLPAGTTDAASAIAQLYSNIGGFKLIMSHYIHDNQTTAIELPEFGIYLACLNNSYLAGAVWIIQSGASTSNIKAYMIAGTSTYFSISSTGKKSFAVVAGGADAQLLIYKLC